VSPFLMVVFLVRRLFLAVLVLFVVVTLTFFLTRLAPGNPFTDEKAIPESILKVLQEKYGLSGSLWHQYTSYLGDVVVGDLRISTKYRNRSVTEILAQTLPVSLTIGGLAFVVSVMVGISLGTVAATQHNRPLDRLSMLVALGGISIPAFVMAPLLVLVFAIHLRWLPVAGWGTWDQILLPAFCLSLPFAASIARLTRGSVLEVLRQDFVRTARAKGLSEFRILSTHVLKVALLPVLSYCGPLAANILTGSMVIEQVFRLPGLGPFFINSVLNKDLYVVAGTVIVFSVFLVVFNLIVDVLYTVLDRRIKLA
jgi:oligopeptide transport system permease protein